MTYLDAMRDRVTAALAPLGLRVVIDPGKVVPPCLELGLTPHPLATGQREVFEWTAVLTPAGTTTWLAAQWLATNLRQVRELLEAAGLAVTEELGGQFETDSDDLPRIPCYVITFQG